MTVVLPDSFIPSLLTEIVNPETLGVTMAGSFARGQGSRFSDVDLQLYVAEKPRGLIGSLVFRQWKGIPVSVHYDTLEDERAKLSRPWQAIWAVPGLRQALVLHDPSGAVARLKQAALDFEWAPLQPLADQFASLELSSSAEEVYKILGGLDADNESKTLYAVLGLTLNLAKIVATQRGLLVETENRYFDLIQESIGRGSEWTRLFRLALGAETGEPPAYRVRGRASLALYLETAKLMDGVIRDEHREVIRAALGLIEER
jgi:hypothetical protein